MDFQSLKEQITNISLYDVKAAVRKAQNVVMNYTEMEAKVREATNNEPWGASSTLMQEIANGTYNYQLLNEIMPMIYKRFIEKSAEEWRQIYKALQLLEFLVKNGSEQVIDDARSHLSTIKMLRQFHFIDLNGKDQGINVRNRAKELGELLNDVDRIRAERKKARAARNKYSGSEGGNSGFGSGLGGSFGRGLGGGNRSSRFGGFGSDNTEYGGYGSNEVYGDGGGFGGSSKYNDEHGASSRSNNRQRFEEYDEYDEGAPPITSKKTDTTIASDTISTTTTTTKISAPNKAVPDQTVDLLSGDDLLTTTSSNGKDKESSSKGLSNTMGSFAMLSGSKAAADDDDFDDFQAAPVVPAATSTTSSNISALLSAPPPPASSIHGTISSSTATTFAAPQPRSSQQAANITGLVGMTTPNIQKSAYAPPPPPPPLQQQPQLTQSSFTPLSPIPAAPTNTAYQPMQPNYFTSIPATPSSSSILSPQSTESTLSSKPAATATKSANDAFSSIWASAAASGIKKPSSAGPKSSTPVPGASMAEMAKSRAHSGLWATPSAPTASGNAFNSLAMGSSNVSKPTQQQNFSRGDLDDLLG